MKNQKVSVSFIDDIKQNSDIKILDIDLNGLKCEQKSI